MLSFDDIARLSILKQLGSPNEDVSSLATHQEYVALSRMQLRTQNLIARGTKYKSIPNFVVLHDNSCTVQGTSPVASHILAYLGLARNTTYTCPTPTGSQCSYPQQAYIFDQLNHLRQHDNSTMCG